MNFPTATYRIQFRNGMTFDRAAELVPYLKALGISHLYASPIFTATSGSTHGYDVTDANEIEPAIGGREGFERMVAALKQAGLGLILDIVPNHMASSLENPWWRDVVENGEQSRFAYHFDIDWSRKLTLPFLGDSFEAVLEAGDIGIAPDPKTGKPALAYFDTFYPLHPDTFAGREADILKTTDKVAISALHDQQPYRLMSWRKAASELSYRRFFEVAGLVGVRVEDDTVFDDSHRLILDLVKSGSVQGLRIDHIDGLADAKGYVERLRQEAGPDCYIVVEKILGEGEQLPPDWPVSGTTGYEFIAALSHALVDGEQLATLQAAYEEVTGEPLGVEAQLRAAKLMMVSQNFEGEVSVLLQLAEEIGAGSDDVPSRPELKTALSEMLIAFPVYRTYGTADGMRPDDDNLLASVIEEVKRREHGPSQAALTFLGKILTGEVSPHTADLAAKFRTKFQQLTGPMMAKSIEDTLFFRQNMLLGLNEVGAEPVPTRFTLQQFHDEMHLRMERQPMGISSTSTHDTKRGEDARALLYALSEAPQAWAKAVDRWRQMNKDVVQHLENGPAPEPGIEWMLYQALAGLLPPDVDISDTETLAALEERFLNYVEKALREAKLRTNWSDPNEAYEQAVKDYASRLLSVDNAAFLTDFLETIRPFIHAGLVNGIAQTVIKLMAPGIPDIYQGSEALDLSLVDPDNRRAPNFDELSQWLTSAEKADGRDRADWYDGSFKQQVIARLLHLRQREAELFQQGDYIALHPAAGDSDNLIAFSRIHDDEAVLVVLPRLSLRNDPDLKLPPSLQHAAIEIDIPDLLKNRAYQNVWTGETVEVAQTLQATFDGCAPFLLLHSTGIRHSPGTR